MLTDDTAGEDRLEAHINASSTHVDLLANYSASFFSWCGFNFDVNTLDVYFNYDKYFNEAAASVSSIKTRLSYTNDYRQPFCMLNKKFLRLFDYNLTALAISARTNSMQAVLRNFVDFFALSAIRFCLLFGTMPRELTASTRLQMRLIGNLCYHLNNVMSPSLRRELLAYFYSTLSLSRFLCLSAYVKLIGELRATRHHALRRLMQVHLRKLQFERCVRAASKQRRRAYFGQLDKLVEQQCAKFYNCQL